MTLSRRQALASGGLVLAGLAGCVPLGPSPRIMLDAEIAEPFESEPPVTVPVAVDVTIRDVGSKDAGFTGVHLECYDAALERLSRRSLGDFTWRAADPSQREPVDDDDSSDEPEYHADWELELAVEVDAVPEFVTFQIDGVQVEGESRSRSLFVGSARALSPPPSSRVSLARYDGARPPHASVVPADYDSVRRYVMRNMDVIVGDTPVVPEGYFPGRELQSLEIEFEDEPIPAGEDTWTTVVAHFADGSTEDVSDQATLSSTDLTHATVDGHKVTGRGPATVTIEAEYLTETGRADLRVVERERTTVGEG